MKYWRLPDDFAPQSGMGVVTVSDEDRVAVFGGSDRGNELDSVELYNTQTEKWETSDFKLNKAKFGFSFLTVKLGDILSKLQWLSNLLKSFCVYSEKSLK